MSKSRKPYSKAYLTEIDIFNAYDNVHDISKEDFKLILRAFFSNLMFAAIDEGKVFAIPPKLGVFGIFKTKTKPKTIDYQLYKTTGIKKYTQNLHSFGWMTKIAWLMRWPKFNVGDSYVHNVFRLKATRDFSRYLAKKIKLDNTITKYYDY